MNVVSDRLNTALSGRYAIEPAPKRAATERTAKDCPKCHAVWVGAPVCPECGYILRPVGKLVRTLDGALVELGEHAAESERSRRSFYLELRGAADARGYRSGWAAHKYREKHGTFPPWSWNKLPAAEPSLTTLRWLKARAIAYAKATAAAVQGAA